jgi:hypothetical protein
MLKLAVLIVRVSLNKPQKSNEITKPIYSDVSSCEVSWPKFRRHFLFPYSYFTTTFSVATADWLVLTMVSERRISQQHEESCLLDGEVRYDLCP